MLCLIKKSSALFFSLLLGASALSLNGCTTRSVPESKHAATAKVSAVALNDKPKEVVRSGRYKLIEISPVEGQRHLLKQMIDVRIPRLTKEPPTVGFALRYVLTDSGFNLCDEASTHAFEQLPLPLVHSHIGPVRLDDALTMLAGPVWQLSVDDVKRQVCFTSISDISTGKK